ncbi:MAG TPA: hypothetical protein VIR30_21720 [Nocardioides sp.]
MKVRDPQGNTWRVTRRWVPWRRRFGSDALDWAPDSMFDDFVWFVLAIPFLVLAVIFGLELLLLLAVLPFAILGRVAFGRHWTVEARKGFTPWFEIAAGGWNDSGNRITQIAEAIQRGALPPRTLGD